MEPERYAVYDMETKIVVNAIMWDGCSQWQPPDGTAVVKSDLLNIGDRVE